MNSSILISPSILAGDFGQLSQEAIRAEQAGADWIHVDVMDGHFVPNLTFGPDAVKAIRKAVSIPLDVHLMISHPQKYAEAYMSAGSDWLTVHVEADHDMSQTLDIIQERGVKAGIALNPDKGLELIEPFLSRIDLVLIMSVFPGFGGQSFMPEVLTKVTALKEQREKQGFHYVIEMDGGITQQTILQAKKAGAEAFVAGTALYGAPDMKVAIAAMREA